MRRALVPALLLAGAGCAGDGDGADPIDEDGAAYLVHSAVETDEGRFNYFTLADALDAPARLDYGRALELPGRARLYAQPGAGIFAIGDGEDVTITRYELDGAALVPGPTISLQGHGVTAMAAQGVLFVSPTKAYYKDAGQAQIIVWNPTEMIVERAIELPGELIQEGWITGFSRWAQRDGEAFLAVSWYSPAYDRVRPGTALVRIDEATDEVTVTADDRCRGITATARVGDDLYFFSDVINGFGHAVYPGDAGQADCFLRVPAGAAAFEAGFVGSLAGALDTDELGTVVAVSDAGEAWVQVADLNITPTAPGTTYGAWYGGGWTWAHLPLATLADPVRVAGEPGAYSGFTLVDGDRFFVSQTAADYSETTLVDLGGAAPADGLSFDGFALDVARLR